MKNYALIVLLFLAACSPTPQRDRVVGNWQVMVENPGQPGALCYAGAAPAETAGTLAHRTGTPYLMVTRRLSGKIEISTSGGYVFMPGSKAEIAVDDAPYTLFFRQDVAWASSDDEDRDIVEDMTDADDIEVRGLTKEGFTAIDTYSSDGFAAALERIRELCP